jgi:hypothetical protein
MLSRAKADIVVREPQNPVAINSEYLISKFQLTDKIENTPSMKLPIILITKIFSENDSKTMGVDAILYLRKAPTMAPTTKKMISIPLIYFHLPFILVYLVGIIGIQFYYRSSSGLLFQG